MRRASATKRKRLAWIVVALTMLAGACASGSESASTTSQPSVDIDDTGSAAEPETDDAADREQTDAAEQDGDESTVNELYVSPIGEALGVAQDEIASGFDTYFREVEDLVHSCMAEAGFAYTPTVIGFNQNSRQAELEATLPPEQFAAEYGFGISTLFELNFKGQGVIDFVNQQFGPAPTTERSPGEQEAYEMAMNGQSTQGLTAEEAQDQLFDGPFATGALPGSCRAEAFETAENPGAAYDGMFAILGQELDALGDRFDNDPRIRDGWAEWQTCMATNGHSYENRFEIFDELFDRSNALGDQYLSSGQVLTALGQLQQENFVSMDGDAREALLEEIGALQGFSWVPEVQAGHDELVAFELLVAADSQDCLDEDLFEQVQFELETDFVQTHADQLALLAADDG